MSVVGWCCVEGLKVYRLLGKARLDEYVEDENAILVTDIATADDMSSVTNTADREVVQAPSRSDTHAGTVTAAAARLHANTALDNLQEENSEDKENENALPDTADDNPV